MIDLDRIGDLENRIEVIRATVSREPWRVFPDDRPLGLCHKALANGESRFCKVIVHRDAIDAW